MRFKLGCDLSKISISNRSKWVKAVLVGKLSATDHLQEVAQLQAG
jgi:hypothetical protein